MEPAEVFAPHLHQCHRLNVGAHSPPLRYCADVQLPAGPGTPRAQLGRSYPHVLLVGRAPAGDPCLGGWRTIFGGALRHEVNWRPSRRTRAARVSHRSGNHELQPEPKTQRSDWILDILPLLDSSTLSILSFEEWQAYPWDARESANEDQPIHLSAYQPIHKSFSICPGISTTLRSPLSVWWPDKACKRKPTENP